MPTIEVYVPDEMVEFAPDLQYFFNTMVRKLHVNRHKGVGKAHDLKMLIGGIKVETAELEKAIDQEGQFDAPLEAADVANFGFLVARSMWHMTREEFEKVRRDLNLAKMHNHVSMGTTRVKEE